MSKRGRKSRNLKADLTRNKVERFLDNGASKRAKDPIDEAVEKAVDYCIANGILADFLSQNRAEAIAVSSREYKEEMLRCRAEEMEIEQKKVGEGIER